MTNYRELRDAAKDLGWEFERQAKGDHQLWRHPVTGRKTTLPRRPVKRRSGANILASLKRLADPKFIDAGRN